jgi:hypothetical protein
MVQVQDCCLEQLRGFLGGVARDAADGGFRCLRFGVYMFGEQARPDRRSTL